MPPTLKDVAAKAGVSVMTVSRCVRKQPGVAPETQAKVETAIRELDYRQHPFVSALMRQVRGSGNAASSANLAFLFFGKSEREALSRPVAAECFEGAKETAVRNGFDLSSVWADSRDLAGPRLKQLLQARGCEGFIIGPPQEMQPLRGFHSFDWKDFSAVAIGQSPFLPEVSRVATNQYHLMQTVLRHLRAIGYDRIGLLLSGEADERVDGQWLAAYLRHQIRNQKGPKIPVYYETGAAGRPRESIDAWIDKYRLDCLIQDRSVASFASRGAMADRPEVLRVRLYQREIDFPDGRILRRNFRGIGRAALRMLLSELIHNARGLSETPVTELIEAEFSGIRDREENGVR